MHSLNTRSMAGRKPISSSWSASSSTCGIMAHEETGFAPAGVKDPRPEVAACEHCCCGHAGPAPNQHSRSTQRSVAQRTRVRIRCSFCASPEFSRWSIRRPGVATSTSQRPPSRFRSLLMLVPPAGGRAEE